MRTERRSPVGRAIERSLNEVNRYLEGVGAHIDAFNARFVNRSDWYGVQLPDGSYRALRSSVTKDLLRRHLLGGVTLGAYALDERSQAKWLCFDADDPTGWARLRSLSEDLHAAGRPGCLERSRRGGHLWLFFAEPLAGRTVRRFAEALLGDPPGKMEIFPKQDEVREGPGSLMRLPFGIHRKTGKRYRICDEQGRPVGGDLVFQLDYLFEIPPMPTSFVAWVLANTSRSPVPPKTRPPTGRELVQESIIERIKESIDIYEFIGQFVELTPSGMGHCPFHDDQHRSFSVNKKGGYFNCFAGCGGGDVIVFWEKLQGTTRREAIRQLAGLVRP